MARADFIHLRLHSSYSLSEGAIGFEELMALCRRDNMPAVAVTDRGNLFGALEFAITAAENGVQPIIGCLLPLDISNWEGKQQAGDKKQLVTLPVLVQNESGYLNLLHLVSQSYARHDGHESVHIAWEDFCKNASGLFILTGGDDGPLHRFLFQNKFHKAQKFLKDLKKLCPGRVYVEIMRHGLPEQNRIEEKLLDLAYTLDLPLLATNDVYFPHPDMFEAHDALLCVAQGSYISVRDRKRVTPEHYFKSPQQMAELFADLPEAIRNTKHVAQRCHFMPEARAPLLPDYPTGKGRSVEEELAAQARKGLEMRLQDHVISSHLSEQDRTERARPYYERLDYELDIINKMGFPGYFLIVADFIKWAKQEGIPVGPGRGSGAGSVVAWSLTITDLDPLRWGLLFERFLNPERISMPDFDIDFCQERRDEVIEYVTKKYGADKVAQIITFGKFQARGVLRDVGRVLQLPYPQVDRLCKMVPHNPARPVTLAQAIDQSPELQQQRRQEPAIAQLMDISLKLEGLYRHASTHAAGVVIADRPLEELVPLYRDPRAPMMATQFNMKYVEKAGLVKFDFLGLKTLTVLAHTLEILAQRKIRIDLSTIPLNDPRSYEIMARGETTGVFQLESAGMRDILRRMKPNRFEDIIALVALYRPGPMDNIPRYIKVKKGKEKADYLHPSLEPVLRETFGIMIYQEQVMQVAQILAGYSLGHADLLRRAMGKKIQSEMDAQKKNFCEGAIARGVERAQAEMIFDQVEKFAGYGFNKSHAAAYALIAYQTAFLKSNYPVDFLAASMTLDYGNTDKLNIFRQEVERLGIALLPPDINASDVFFSPEDRPLSGQISGQKEKDTKAIRYALAAIKGVGVDAMQALVEERTKNGPFTDVFNFVERVDHKVLNKRQFENLVKAGAFDSLNPNRHQVLAATEMLLRWGQTHLTDRLQGQTNLFAQLESKARPPWPQVDDWPLMEKLRFEFEAIGFYLSAHPLDSFDMERLGVVPSREIVTKASSLSAKRLCLAGIVVAKREQMTRNNKRIAFVTFSDPSGSFEAVMFEEVLFCSRALLEVGTPVLLSTDVQINGDEYRLSVSHIRALEEAQSKRAFLYDLHIRVGAGAASKDEAEDYKRLIEQLRSAQDQDARNQVNLLVSYSDQTGGARLFRVELPGYFAISPNWVEASEKLALVERIESSYIMPI